MHSHGNQDDQSGKSQHALAPVTLSHRRPGRVAVELVEGPGAGRRVAVERTRVVVGRSPVADIVIDHPSVSPLHMELLIEAEGVKLQALDSANGIWLGAYRVESAVVSPGMSIAFGDCKMTLDDVSDIEVQVLVEEHFGQLFGRSLVMREALATLHALALGSSDVLITGETGTGKELAARALHVCSSRTAGRLSVIDCGREAFGSFTRDPFGIVEAADHGTLFVDEVSLLSPEHQVELLRLLDRRVVTKRGEKRPRKLDIRIVATTNSDLLRMVADGKLREDLFTRLTRLSQSQIAMPPLRDRGDDVLDLAEHFLAEVARARGLQLHLSPTSKRNLLCQWWPGNVRQLKTRIEVDAWQAKIPEVELRLTHTLPILH